MSTGGSQSSAMRAAAMDTSGSATEPQGSVRPCRRAITRIGTRCKRIGTIRAEPSHYSKRSARARQFSPQAARPGLPRRLGFDLCESRWHATEAGFGFLGGISALPAAGSAQGSQPTHTASHPWIVPTGGWRGSGDGIGTAGPLLGPGDGGHLLARFARTRPGGCPPVGQLHAPARRIEQGTQRGKLMARKKPRAEDDQ